MCTDRVVATATAFISVCSAIAYGFSTDQQDISHSSPTIHAVVIHAFKFEPQHLKVKVGDTIRWLNHDLAPHTATAESSAVKTEWDTKSLAQGENREITVMNGMQGEYYCIYHPHMKATFEVSTD